MSLSSRVNDLSTRIAAEIKNMRVNGETVPTTGTTGHLLTKTVGGNAWQSPTELIQDTLSTTLVQGANVTLTYDDGAGTLTVAATGGGGGSGLTHGEVMTRTALGW